MDLLIILIIIGAYLLGSISTSILICKILHYPDPRNYGSKNPGTTNTLRIAGQKIAISVLTLDILKGIIPVWISYQCNVPSLYLNITAISVCIGHIYPIFFKFYGGKGVATAFGTIITMDANLSFIMISSWTLTLLLFKYSSLASIITAIIISLYTWYIQSQHFFPIAIISTLIIIRHIANIKRLWHHQETQIWNHSKLLKKFKNKNY